MAAATATAPQARTLKPEMATNKLQTQLLIDGQWAIAQRQDVRHDQPGDRRDHRRRR